jgi:NAD(P)-dependent dehydrogenase (short-subunit alcohol dehydrogenase family)
MREPSEKQKRLGKRCYVCNNRSHHPGPFCEPCHQMNDTHRHAKTDMTGKVCVVTGCRLKIGYQAALSLLRMGATVIGTTRFPADALRRFQAETDGAEITTRLRIFRVDLLCMSDIASLTNRIMTECPRLHVVVNNAAQTIRRPRAFYEHLLDAEDRGDERVEQIGDAPTGGEPLAIENLPMPEGRDKATTHQAHPETVSVSPVEVKHITHMVTGSHEEAMQVYFPPGELDADGQQVDLRPENSWTQAMGEVDPVELVECLLVNAAAPFILVQNLLPRLSATEGLKFIVNASAMEGKFNRYKTHFHPHTNMAKAALNQWVRTSGGQLAKSNIFMTAVDTGWVTDERPVRFREALPYDIPLDSLDGAMRLLHPIIGGYSGEHLYHSVFLKDYQYTSW